MAAPETGSLRDALMRDARPLIAALAVALAVHALFFADGYDLRLLTVAGAYALMVLGYQFVFGHAGALSLAQGTFFGIGAYATGLLALRMGWTFPFTFPASILAAVLLALLVSLPVLRLRSHYFALATLGISQVALLVATDWVALTGGSNGLPGVPGVRLFGTEIPAGLPLALFVWGWVLIGILVAVSLLAGPAGLRFRLLRADPIAADAAGVDGFGHRFAAFLLSAAFGGAAGALFAHTIRIASTDTLEFGVMVACLSMAVVGGRTRIAGAILGAVLLIHLPEWFRFLERHALIAYGGALLLVILVAPGGLVGAAERIWNAVFKPRPAPLPAAHAVKVQPRHAGAPETRLLTGTGLTKRFGGNLALDGVGVTVARGEIVGLIGPNGSGKTTLLNILTGLYRADAGRVALRGRSVTNWPAWRLARAGIGRGHQQPALPAEIPVLDIVASARLGHAFARTVADARADARGLLDTVGLGKRAAESPDALSQAERRRLEIARALALEPDVLMLDEPAAGLSEAEQQALAATLRGLRERGFGLLLVDHNMRFLARLADRLVCLDAGRIVAEGLPAEVLRDPAVVEVYLGTPQAVAE